MLVQRVLQMGHMGPMRWPWYTQPTWLWVLVGGSLVALGYLLAQSYRDQTTLADPPARAPARTPAGGNDKVEVAMRLLNENERKVVEAILGNGGEMLQKDIGYESGLNRVQVHRAVQSLEGRGLVTTEEYFNTKKVRLADWLRE